VFEVAFNGPHGGYMILDEISFSPEFCNAGTGMFEQLNPPHSSYLCVIKAEFSASLLNLQCHMILQKSFQYVNIYFSRNTSDYYQKFCILKL